MRSSIVLVLLAGCTGDTSETQEIRIDTIGEEHIILPFADFFVPQSTQAVYNSKLGNRPIRLYQPSESYTTQESGEDEENQDILSSTQSTTPTLTLTVLPSRHLINNAETVGEFMQQRIAETFRQYEKKQFYITDIQCDSTRTSSIPIVYHSYVFAAPPYEELQTMYMQQAYIYLAEKLWIVSALTSSEEQSKLFASYLESIECKASTDEEG